MSDGRARASGQLGAIGIPYLGLVAIEFLCGMGLNLFVVLPGGSVLHVLEATPLLDVHVVVGLLLLGIATRSLVLAVALREVRAIGFTAVGLVSGVGAFVAGLVFAFGDPSPAASYVMSLGFVGLLVAAGFLMWRHADARLTLGTVGVGSSP